MKGQLVTRFLGCRGKQTDKDASETHCTVTGLDYIVDMAKYSKF